MVQSLGISVGNCNCFVAAGQGGGIEMLLNEYSNRSTPSMVAFTEHSRCIGMDASSNFLMNIKNTIYDLMVLLGKPFDKENRPNYPFIIEESADGQLLVVVRHLGQERKFTITQVLAMLFTKLRGVANDSTDCVISCPQFFDDAQKAALLQAALIAGLNPLQIISDTSAIVLNYAYYRTAKEDPQKIIAFIDFGQSNLQTVVAWLNPAEDDVRILAAESELIGGKDFDQALAEHFVNENKLTLTPKSYHRLLISCEKLKKLLSANANEIPLHVESLVSDDKDFTARIDRATFESLSENLLQRVEACFKRTIENAKMLAEVLEIEFNLEAVEIVGGATRIPAVRQLIQSVFNTAPSTTLNTDEAVARGCVLHCATLHPGMKVKRELKILGSEFFFQHGGMACDKDLRRVELELITSDRKYKSRTEARNALEEYIYSERSKLQGGDQFLGELTTTLDWLVSDEGEDATEEEYVKKMSHLREISKARLTEAVNKAKAAEEAAKKAQQPPAGVDMSKPSSEEVDKAQPSEDQPMAE